MATGSAPRSSNIGRAAIISTTSSLEKPTLRSSSGDTFPSRSLLKRLYLGSVTNRNGSVKFSLAVQPCHLDRSLYKGMTFRGRLVRVDNDSPALLV